jgi:hypothetical protein
MGIRIQQHMRIRPCALGYTAYARPVHPRARADRRRPADAGMAVIVGTTWSDRSIFSWKERYEHAIITLNDAALAEHVRQEDEALADEACVDSE